MALSTKSSPVRAASNAARIMNLVRVAAKPAARRSPDRDPAGERPTDCILVVMRPRRPSSVWALERARVLANSPGTSVTFLCVLPALRSVGDRALKPQQTQRATARVAEWFARHGGAPAHSQVLVRVGQETSVAAQIGHALRASVMVVGVAAGAGHEWVAVARRSGIPVLLARAPTRSRVIVAASDFSIDRVPTFTWAVRLALANESRVTLVHSVDPRGETVSRRIGVPLPRAAVSDVKDKRAKKLASLTRGAPVPCDSVLLDLPSKELAGGIAQIVAARKADLLVVGARGKERTQTATTTNLVSRVRSSVLVVPLDAT